MNHLSYKEAYVLSFISRIKKNKDIKQIVPILLGLYVCHFLDHLETMRIEIEGDFRKALKEYFSIPNEVWAKDNLLIPVLKKLINLKLLRPQRKKGFNLFSLVEFPQPKNSVVVKDVNSFIFDSLQAHRPFKNTKKIKELIRIFNKKLLSSFKKYERKHSKFELRFFWPETVIPEVYDCGGNFFESKKFKKEHTIDRYILKDENSVLKYRRNQLQEKRYVSAFNNIRLFAEKERKRVSLQSNFIEVTKERYFRKLGVHSKVEFSHIKVQGEDWNTLCIESTKLKTVLALSLLINQDHSEGLSYPEFLKKFYSTKEL